MKKHILLALILLLSCALVQAQVELTSSDLPIVVINTNGEAIKDDPKIMADMGIIDNGPGEQNQLTDPFNDYNGKIGIEIRGSSSQMFPKKQYGVETRDEAGEDLNVSLLGMPEEDDWVLFAPYNDKSLMRDVLAYKLGRDMGRYAPRTRYCELVLNGQYQGIYVLIEKVKRDKQRVDINRLNPDEISGNDLSGGYIVKIDKSTGSGGDGFISTYPPKGRNGNQTIFFQYDYPKSEDIVQEQKDYISQFIRNFETALAGDDFRDPSLGYARYIDEPSFVDFFLINELTKNVDGYRLSTFMHKQRDSDGGKLVMGPIWDFNLAFGNADYCTKGNPEGFVYRFNKVCPNDHWLVPFWWERLLENRSFRAHLHQRWDELRSGPYETEKILDYIDSVADILDQGPQQRNFTQWPVLGAYVWPNYYVGNSFQEEIDWLKEWVAARLEWMDGEIGSLVTGSSGQMKGDESNFLVYPNPFVEEFQVEYFLSRPSELAVEIFDARGKRLNSMHAFSEVGNQRLKIPNEHFSKGIYFLQISVEGTLVATRKVVRR